ncbi:wax ester/triacylglycerol synthase family O-acyltransferase [Actinomycetospora endophytica]|uniref:Diacylglycerol O-acyltransferase n=1 Tax=Actinomycetospora endophytica TaxID=2291215 RepID=A0ABS8P6L7_9PSEU|nr:wax ester/triacylglycerol synthase family O-acyltransferase [Actinomycetospora endophytica]MCD2193881.1 wax ester/triacylglycerol synthase family O-acyltransferase [Actinomycetospora endophytica]
MQQLSGLDATFLDVEDDHQATHISQLVVLDLPHPDADPYTAWRQQLADRLHLLEPLRRRLVEVPLGLDHPYWISEDPDLDFHVRHSAVPPPGTDDQLDTLVGRLIAGPMDRDHPLWVSHVISGLAPTEESPHGRFALLTMVHHAAVDGASGAKLLTLMLDDAPDAERPADAGSWEAEDAPSTTGLLGRAAWHGLARPGRALLLAARAGQQVAAATRQPAVIDLADRVRRSLRGPVGDVLNLGRHRDPDAAMPRLPATPAPPTPFNGPISRYRRFCHRSVPLADVKAVAAEADVDDVTINDVVVAACAGALRTYLLEHDALPDAPLTALIPVSLRTGDEADTWTNRVSGTIASLPTDVTDPHARLAVAHRALDAAKAVFAVTPAGLAPDGVDLGAPAVSALVSRATMWWSTHAVLPFNVVISNVPGPREPLYIGEARARHYFPVSAIVDGQGLNMTVQSYAGSVEIGLLSCARRVPDVSRLADLVVAEFAALRGTAS